MCPHPRLDQRQRLDRIHEGVPLEQLPLDPEQVIQFCGVERAESAPEDQVLRPRDGRDRVDLEEAEAPNGVEHALRGAVEKLRADRDAARLFERDRSSLCHRATLQAGHSRPSYYAAEEWSSASA